MKLGTQERPLRVAVIGSGPSGFYAAQALMKAEIEVEIDIVERLPSPYGLVRLGVAPDHPKIKNVIGVFERIAAKPNCRFLGNVTVGRDIAVEELRRHYDALIFANGAETDRRLNIPGEDLPGSYTATEFVAWYNGHPDYRDREFDLSQETAVVIGQGNVAIDVCRILAKTADELKHTDITQRALDALAESRIKDIYMVGRRGPVQAKFTQLEIKEMGQLADCDPVVRAEDLQFDPASQAEYDDPKNKAAKRIVPILGDFAARELSGKARRLHILFKQSPAEIKGDGRVQSIVLERNELVGEAFSLKARGTGETEELACGLVFRSVGYRGVPLPGVPFDEQRGVIPNEDGRVLDHETPVSGLYAVGWIKRGPSGVIGTNKPDSRATVASLLQDLPNLQPCPDPETDKVLALLKDRGVRVVSFEDWQIIDAAEVERGQASGKPREKYPSVEEMLATLE